MFKRQMTLFELLNIAVEYRFRYSVHISHVMNFLNFNTQVHIVRILAFCQVVAMNEHVRYVDS